jgi:histidinol phosphatase-like PHP family hydrolase/predicted nuclease with RNAse H fold/dephospho-CoA kinase
MKEVSSVFDFEIARFLYRIAFLYEKIHNSPYKARAYFKAALAADGYSRDINILFYEGKLKTLPSIGVSIEKNISEIINTGQLKLINELLGDIPDTIFELYEHANINDKLLKTLVSHKIFSFAHISNILEQHINYFSLAEAKALASIIKNRKSLRFQYAHVYELSKELMVFMQKSGFTSCVSLSDELFLYRESLISADIICTPASDFNSFLHNIQTISSFRFVSSNDNEITLERFYIPFKIHVLSENEYNKKIQELQIEKKKLEFPHENKNIVSCFYGDLHIHTKWSDGLHSIEQMHDMAVELGYSYIAITDHSQSLKPSGMSELDTITQIKKIREMRTKNAVPILAGIEVDILADGSLDLPDSILKEFDIVIASIHSHFNQPPIILNERLSKALSNKYVNILAHPMGRLLGRPGKPTVSRKELQLDFDNLLQICLDNDVALEINCFPERFDLSLDNAKKAIQKGIKISVGTDSHSMYHMSCIKYILEALKFVKAPEEAVLNCQPLDKLKQFINIKRDNKQNDTTDVFGEKFKNFNRYFEDNDGIISSRIKSIGIDLTGSEKKASGFAVLSGPVVETFPILTDDEIIESVLKVKPDIISIDSPLSLPAERCCGDKNCECAKHGIMRYCELTLKRFGIGVYPCLIDSMVSLTMRGIKLASRLRGLGFKVIESYPGVAQDLLHIPRKRKGLELLLNGMKNFGIEGIRDDITHDEADAITSALVGYFYLDDKYTGLGNDKENYLIVPKLETSLSGKGIVIGLVGRIAAGKTTSAEYLCFKHGFTSMRFSGVIKEKYNVSGRDAFQKIGLEISKDPTKQKELSDIMIKRMKNGENYVIDGLRQVIDYGNLSSALGDRFVLVGIESPLSIRANRYCKDDLNVSRDEFIRKDEHPVEMTIEKILYKSNYKVINNKSYKELMNMLDSILFRLGK